MISAYTVHRTVMRDMAMLNLHIVSINYGSLKNNLSVIRYFRFIVKSFCLNSSSTRTNLL